MTNASEVPPVQPAPAPIDEPYEGMLWKYFRTINYFYLHSGPPALESVVLKKSEKELENFKTFAIRRDVEIKFNLINFSGDIGTLSSDLDHFYRRLVEPLIRAPRFNSRDHYCVVVESPVLNKRRKNDSIFISKLYFFTHIIHLIYS